MIHIFKGVHEYRKDYFCYVSMSTLDSFKDVIYVEELHKSLINNKILPHAYIRNICEKTEWVEFSRTNLIEQRLNTGDKIIIEGKELFAKEVIQCDNGDVIVHVGDNTFSVNPLETSSYDRLVRSDYVLKSTRDTEAYIKAKEIEIEYKRIIEEKKNKKPQEQKQKEVISKKKWWQFWR